MKKIGKKIHMLGIGGISMSAIALILKAHGYIVSGSDSTRSDITDKLIKHNIDVCIGSISDKIDDADLIVVSASISSCDKELLKAKALGKTIISRAKMLGFLAGLHKKVISVAGSHGKTTTTGMIAQIFLEAGLNPTVHIGGEMEEFGNVHIGSNEYFITEACEYVDSFLELKSDISVILNIQNDHLDYFKTFENINKSFTKFSRNTKKGGLVVYLADDPSAAKKHYTCRSVGFSTQHNGIIEARNIKEYQRGKYKFDVFMLNTKLMKIRLGVYGIHNVNNALAAISVALECGIDIGVIKDALLKFKGIKRRFELCGSVNDCLIVHDYAHHPTEIRATIDIAKRIARGDIFVVFQPHTFSRTKLLLEEFKTCFSRAKEVCVYKVYPARETKDMGIDEKELARQISLSGQKAFSFEDYAEMKQYLLDKLKPNDMVLVLGAGDIVSFPPYFQRAE